MVGFPELLRTEELQRKDGDLIILQLWLWGHEIFSYNVKLCELYACLLLTLSLYAQSTQIKKVLAYNSLMVNLTKKKNIANNLKKTSPG